MRTAFKAFTKNLTATCGRGVLQFELGKWYEEDEANTAHNGFHCAYNPLDCLSYYHGSDDRYFIVAADGDMDLDAVDSKIACTRIKLLKEIDFKALIFYGVNYIVDHPNLEVSQIKTDKYHSKGERYVIVRGKNPSCMASKGTIVALLKEDDEGDITEIDFYEVDGKEHKANRYYAL